jgi:hypothetical protein
MIALGRTARAEAGMELIGKMELWQFFAASGVILSIVQMWMKTMIPLRTLAITTNVLFLSQASLLVAHSPGSWSTLILNSILLPLNIYRLREMRNLIRKVESASRSDLDMVWLQPFMSKRSFKSGETLFRKGDVAEAMYLVVSGRFELAETGIEIAPGNVVGELGLLAPDRRRTQSLICREGGEVMSLSYDRFEELYFQNPEFGLGFLKLTSRRLFENIARLEGQLAAARAAVPIAAQARS